MIINVIQRELPVLLSIYADIYVPFSDWLRVDPQLNNQDS